MDILCRLRYGPIRKQTAEPVFVDKHQGEVAQLEDVMVTITQRRFGPPYHPFVPADTRTTTRSSTPLDGNEAWEFAEETVQSLRNEFSDARVENEEFELRKQGKKGYVKLVINCREKQGAPITYKIVFVGVYSI